MRVLAKSSNTYLVLLSDKTRTSMRVSVLNDDVFFYPGRRTAEGFLGDGGWSEVGEEEASRVLEVVMCKMDKE